MAVLMYAALSCEGLGSSLRYKAQFLGWARSCTCWPA